MVNNLESLIGQSSIFENDACLASHVRFTTNELRFADYCDSCDFHACRKRERKSDYQK